MDRRISGSTVRRSIGGDPTREVVLLHATARREKEWPLADWIALARALAARGYSPVLPWGNESERTRSVEIAAAVPGATVPDRKPLDAGGAN